MMRGFSSRTTSQPSPSRSIVPGAMFSTVTSAFFSRSLTISSPRGDLRLSVIDFLLALNWWKYQGSLSGLPGSNRRPGSPVFGFSILTTSAPSQASASVQDGPASNCVRSTTRTPSRQSSSTPIPSILRTPLEIRGPPTAPHYSAGHPVGETGVAAVRAMVVSRAWDTLVLWRIAFEGFDQPLRVDADLDSGALLLNYHR